MSLLKTVCEKFAQNWNPDKESKYEQISSQNKEICVQICLSLFSFAAKNNQQCGTLLWNILSLLHGKKKKEETKESLTTMQKIGHAMILHVGDTLGWADGLVVGYSVGFNVGDVEGFIEGISVDKRC